MCHKYVARVNNIDISRLLTKKEYQLEKQNLEKNLKVLITKCLILVGLSKRLIWSQKF